MAGRALIVETDGEHAQLLGSYLAQEGFAVSHARDGRRAIALLETSAFELVVFDAAACAACERTLRARVRSYGAAAIVMLPRQPTRSTEFPATWVPRRADAAVAVSATPRAMMTAIRAVLARRAASAPLPRFQVGELLIDPPAHGARVAGRWVPLTDVELRLLSALARTPGVVVRRDQLSRFAHRDHEPMPPRQVDVHVCNLRRKLQGEQRRPQRIRTVRGVGYVLVDRSGDGSD